jgi:DNA invertase Pin-like site-specific DNA recombinase
MPAVALACPEPCRRCGRRPARRKRLCVRCAAHRINRKPLPEERERVRELHRQGWGVRRLMRHFRIGQSTCISILQD